MDIPKKLEERDRFFKELIDKCTATCDDREREYGVLRNFYLFGCGPDEDEAPFNKIYPSIDLLTSFLFAAETTRFSTHLPAEEDEHEYKKLPVWDRAINDEWLSSNADMVFSMSLTWALVHNSSFIKLVVRDNQVNPFVVDAASMGMLREDVAFLDRQDAIVHTFYTTKDELQRTLARHPQRDSIIARIDTIQVSPQQPPSGLDRVITSAVSPNMVGNAVTPVMPRNQYIPMVGTELVKMQELWVWDNEAKDYRVVTRSENDVTIYDRPNFFLPGEHPFVQVCPQPLPGYVWGRSEVAGLISLQRMRNHRMNQIVELLDKQARPPKAAIGMGGLLEEKLYALNMAGGTATSTEPMGKIEEYAPKIPEDIYKEVHEIDGMFAEMTGLQNILQGKGESGVRSGRQTSELARLSSARIRKRALTIEDSLERMATLYGKFLRVYRKTDYVDSDGVPFLANQFPEHFVVKVDAHSNSPIFVEDQKALAEQLLEAHAIDRESYLDMVDPPGKELLKRKLKKLEAEEKQQQDAQQQAEAQKGRGQKG